MKETFPRNTTAYYSMCEQESEWYLNKIIAFFFLCLHMLMNLLASPSSRQIRQDYMLLSFLFTHYYKREIV
jgi:hypothetical protein